jgi:hypothetical protein
MSSIHAAHQPNPNQPSMKPFVSILLAVTTLASVSCSGRPVPSLAQTYNGKPVLTRASHPQGGSMHAVDGVYLGRRYFHPQGVKSGLAWIDVYGQR